MQVNFKKFKMCLRSEHDSSLCLTKVQHNYSSINTFQMPFRVNFIERLFCQVQNFTKPYNFLLLSTTVLNEYVLSVVYCQDDISFGSALSRRHTFWQFVYLIVKKF